MTHKLGMIQYINALPLHMGLPAHYTLTLDVPTTLNSLLRSKELDYSFISTYEYLCGNYSALNYGIEAQGEVLSVNLYIKNECEFPKIIALTQESATSVALLKVLVTHFWKKKVGYTPLRKASENEAFLLIGDQALQHFTIAGYRRIDLAKEWFRFTALPFPFAILATHHTENQIIEKEIEDSLKWSEMHRETLLDRAYQQCRLEKEFLKRYYSCLNYRLNDSSWEALRTFKDYVSKTTP